MNPEGPQSSEQAFVCGRCGKSGPKLDEPPFPTELGKEILEKICKSCWQEWFATSIRVVNEYRLDLMQPEAAKIYDQCMCEFLGLGQP